MPRGIGNLTNLKVLREFRVEERGKWNAARMNELRRLTGLEELSIEYLGRVKKESDRISTSDADYFWIDKSRLQRLQLSWGGDDDDDREYPSEYAEEVLERLKPNLDFLKSFTIYCYQGTRLPSWISRLDNLDEIKIQDCYHIRRIPPLDQLCFLKSIELNDLRELEWIEVTENSICLYPSLENICLYNLPMLKGCKRKRMDVNRSGYQSIHSSSSLFFIPSFSRKVHFQKYECGIFSYMYDDKEGVLLQLERMKYKDLEELWRRNMSNVEEEEEPSSISTTQMESLRLLPLSSVPLHMLTSLDLIKLEDTEELPMELFQSLSRLQSLKITDCYRLKSLSEWWILRYLPSLEYLDIRNCKELDLSSMDQEEDNKAIQGIPNSQTKMRVLILYGMNKMKTLPPWIQYLPKLENIKLINCKNMETLPGWFSQLTSLKKLLVFDCGELSRKCQRDKGECWPRISHIEYVDIR